MFYIFALCFVLTVASIPASESDKMPKFFPITLFVTGLLTVVIGISSLFIISSEGKTVARIPIKETTENGCHYYGVDFSFKDGRTVTFTTEDGQTYKVKKNDVFIHNINVEIPYVEIVQTTYNCDEKLKGLYKVLWFCSFDESKIHYSYDLYFNTQDIITTDFFDERESNEP